MEDCKMKVLNLKNRTISCNREAFIMGIVNCTPDSFYDKSRGGSEHALSLIDEGADILDLGGESTRPGSQYVDAQEEIKRLVPIIKEIRKHSDIPISVDTRKYEVFKVCYDEGADMVNDISALEDDEKLGFFVSETEVPVVLMHKRGIPVNMQDNTSYKDAFSEVDGYLKDRVCYAESIGIKKNKIIIDPGIGFGKNLKDNSSLIARGACLCGGEYPVLMALSRKSCIGDMTGKNVEERLYGTLAANLISVIKGASIVRVHDVAPCRDTLAVLQYLKEFL